MKFIVGLGNPDKKYEMTRHNVGFMIVNKLANKHNLKWRFEKKFNAEITKSTNFFLVKPMTYMNNSGKTLQKILFYYDMLASNESGIEPDTNLTDDLVVIHDDLDIALGNYKYATGSSSAGHNGVQSVIDELKTKSFARVRVGIATQELEQRKKSWFGGGAKKYVLSRFKKDELAIVDRVSDKIIDIL